MRPAASEAGRCYPRLLDDVTVVRTSELTLLTTPSGRYTGGAGLYDVLTATAPLLDGSRSLAAILDDIDEARRDAVAAVVDFLASRGALRREARAVPPAVDPQILAVTDARGGDSYAASIALRRVAVRLRGPDVWTDALHRAATSLGLDVGPTSDTEGGADDLPGHGPLVLDLGPVQVGLDANDDWLGPAVGSAERAVMAAAMITVAVCRFLDVPTPDLPRFGAVPGLGRTGDAVSITTPLAPEWPSAAWLDDLLQRPSSLLPRQDPGHRAPAMIRPGLHGLRRPVPEHVVSVLRPVHAPLRWEQGGHAHGGGQAHRGLASARCLYPVEFYLLLPDDAWYLEPGLDRMVLVSGTDGPVPPDEFALALTVRETKVAYRYLEYATRLCSQEAGLALAAVVDAATAAGMTTCAEAVVSARGHAAEHGARLRLGADERVVGYVRCRVRDRLNRSGARSHLDRVRRRRSGRHVFNSLGTRRRMDLGDALDRMSRVMVAPLVGCVVTHRTVATARGDLEPGRYPIGEGSPVGVLPGMDPTRWLQDGHAATGWLAPDYRSAIATLLLAAPASALTDLAAFHAMVVAAARPVHHVLMASADLGLAGRVHNGLDPATATQVMGSDEIRVLFQVLVGAPRPDGTLVCRVDTDTSAGFAADCSGPSRARRC